jgi:pentalenene synthase
MSEAWRARSAHHWRLALHGNASEAFNRRSGAVGSVEEYRAIRNLTIGTQPVLDRAERLGQFEVPECAYYSKQLILMRELAAELVVLANDLISLEKEKARGEQHNLNLRGLGTGQPSVLSVCGAA